MTALDTPPATAAGATLRGVGRSARGPLLAVLALVVASVVGVIAVLTAHNDALDPDSYTPAGSRAVAELLRDRGVTVERAESGPDVLRRARSAGTLVVVPFPKRVLRSELEQLADLPLLLVQPEPEDLEALGAALEPVVTVSVQPREPACALPAAVRAGDAHTGGLGYLPTGAATVVGCYASRGLATVVHVPEQRLTVLGSGEVLTNRRLDERGNAALALGLVGDAEQVLWLIPRPGARATDREHPSLGELLPPAIPFGAAALALTAVVLALWRARRLGPVVTEPLPVVVRAAEAVEGRGRLYHAAGARGTAAEQLRGGVRERAVRRLGLPAGASPEGVVGAVAKRVGRDPGAVRALLYGAAPDNDAALVRLATELSALDEEVALR